MKSMMWQYRGVHQQTNAGGGNVVVEFLGYKGMLMEVLLVGFGPDNYAANRTLTVEIYDQESTPLLVQQLDTEALDNVKRVFPNDGTTKTRIDPRARPYKIGGYYTIRITAAALAQNETLTCWLQALVDSGYPPTPSTALSTGTISTSTTYNYIA